MKTPICDFVRDYLAREPLRLHMPGHKGVNVLGCESRDITEIPGADVLYHADGIILESEQNAAYLFGARRTFYSAEGSSLPIRAMLYMVRCYSRQRGICPTILAGRNAHKVFLSASALLDIPVRWICPEEQADLLTCPVTPALLRSFLEREIPAAVYITSPDYLGNMTDVRGLAEVCREFGCLLLVDNAHGAYLRFLPESLHPMDLGADLCCDSAHKTLNVLTGGAYLHISKNAPTFFADHAEQALALFASTSPSYLILQSLDMINAALATEFPAALAEAAAGWDSMKREIAGLGFRIVGGEPLKLTIAPKSFGYNGPELAAILENNGVFCEFFDPDYLVLMLPAKYNPSVAGALSDIFSRVPRRDPIPVRPPAPHLPAWVISPHEALFRPAQRMNVRESVGRIMADPCVSCPPAIPVAVCGERIDEAVVETMLYYGMESVHVVSEE